jgi:hypothetical protein
MATKLAADPPEQVWFCSLVSEERLHGALKYGDPVARTLKPCRGQLP